VSPPAATGQGPSDQRRPIELLGNPRGPVGLAERLTRLTDVLVALSGSPIPTHLFQTVADLAPAAVPCDYLAVCLPNPDGPGYLVHSLAALPRDIGAEVWPPDQGVPGRVMRSGRASVIDDVAAMDGASALEEILARAGLRAVLAVPVRRGVEVSGALLFARRPPGTYDQEDVQIATLVAAGLGSALESSRVYQALADERSTLAAVLGSSSDAVVMVNDDGVVLLANPAVGSMLGLAPDAMVGRRLTDVPGHESLRSLFQGKRSKTVELPLSDGRTAQASLVSVVTPYGEPVGVAAVLRDITLLKNLERMKNEFVNTVSHDLKNPISIIDGTAQLLLMSGPRDEKSRDRYQRISTEAQYMAALVNDLLDLGKIEAGLDPPKERCNIVPLVKEAVVTTAPQAEDKGVTIGIELPGEAWVSGAPARLKQALLNLVGNAVKYTPAGGRVTVSVLVADGPASSPADAAVTVRVADTGIGIPARHLPHVFDKFYRVHDASTKGIPGTGLGLAITKSIVESHGGRIRVESAEAVGSVFLVDLPAHPSV
jgi:PAS domain S-box-containing protein